MLYEANIYQMQVEGHIFWIAESKSLKGCVGQGDTSEDAICELEENEREWIETAKEYNIPIPEPTVRTPKTYSGKISLRVSPIVHENATLSAESLGISLNQFINDALISYTESVNNLGRQSLKKTPVGDMLGKIVQFPSNQNSSYSVIEDLEEM